MRPGLEQDTLHASLQDPLLDSIGFLNEIMSRFPQAISFAPGAPHLAHLLDDDITRYAELYVDHMRRTEAWTCTGRAASCTSTGRPEA